MKIAVVILNWNGRDLLEKFLPSIVRYSPTEYADIYVADNASTDESIAYIKKEFTTVKIIQNKENWGFAKGYNKALKHVKADIYGIVNSDIEVTPNWLEPIYAQFISNKKTAIIQPKIIDYKKKTHFEYAGAAGGFIDKLGYTYCKGRVFNTLEEDKGQYDATYPIFWGSGACLFIRSTVFHQLGGFDADFYAHQEEIDLCWRAQNFEYQVTYVGASTVYHVGGATLDNYHWRKTFLNFRNSLFNLTKNVPHYKRLIFFRLLLDGIAGVKFLLEGKPIHTWAIIKAHFSFYANYIKMRKKRKNTPMKREDYFQTTSIVWSYFIKKKKTFSKFS
jgi:GT2 family glycosyltransferase